MGRASALHTLALNLPRRSSSFAQTDFATPIILYSKAHLRTSLSLSPSLSFLPPSPLHTDDTFARSILPQASFFDVCPPANLIMLLSFRENWFPLSTTGYILLTERNWYYKIKLTFRDINAERMFQTIRIPSTGRDFIYTDGCVYKPRLRDGLIIVVIRMPG